MENSYKCVASEKIDVILNNLGLSKYDFAKVLVEASPNSFGTRKTMGNTKATIDNVHNVIKQLKGYDKKTPKRYLEVLSSLGDKYKELYQACVLHEKEFQFMSKNICFSSDYVLDCIKNRFVEGKYSLAESNYKVMKNGNDSFDLIILSLMFIASANIPLFDEVCSYNDFYKLCISNSFVQNFHSKLLILNESEEPDNEVSFNKSELLLIGKWCLENESIIANFWHILRCVDFEWSFEESPSTFRVVLNKLDIYIEIPR